MGTAAALKPDKRQLEGHRTGRIGSVQSALAVIIMVQVAVTAGLYLQTLELKKSEAETQEHIISLREQIDALDNFLQSEEFKSSRESCPPCPSLQEKMEAALRNVHKDFEKTAEQLKASVSNLQTTINHHAKKLNNLAEKAQNSPLLKLFQNM